MNIPFPLKLIAGLVSFYIVATPVYASESVKPSEPNFFDDLLLDLSLEELISLEVPDVTSVSKRQQRLMDSPAAVYVITSDDLKRSGVTSIPEALRMVPGVQVARMNSSTWSISARGFNYIFANKILVLIDGRTVYSPLFSGVNWDVQDTMLEDIDRIEVIRGPGAALWGSNAVNGVINIITKHSADTQGGLLSATVGTEEKVSMAYRYGGEFEQGTYRAFVKSFSRDAMKNKDGSSAEDDWQLNRAGFRADWRTDAGNNMSLSAELYEGQTQPGLKIYNYTGDKGKDVVTDLPRDQRGGHLIGNYTTYLNNGSSVKLKGYYDRYESDDYRATEQRDLLNLEMQHQLKRWQQHELIWGAGYRFSHYDLSDMRYISMDPAKQSEHQFSAFIQDYITFTPQWGLTLSSRLEHNDSTGFEVQPNASLTWKISDQQTAWFKVASALKTPSISETSATTRGIVFLKEKDSPVPGYAEPNMLSIQGNANLDSERLLAFESGYRQQIGNNLLLDATVFFNQYDNLLAYVNTEGCGAGASEIELAPGVLVCSYGKNSQGDTVIEYASTFTNALSAHTYGLELSADWQVKPSWRLQANYSYLGVDAFSDPSSSAMTQSYLTGNERLLEELSAEHTANIRSHWSLPHQWSLDVWVRYMGELKDAEVPAYTTMDVQLSKQWSDNIELALIGQNLLEPEHAEFNDVFSGLEATEVESSWMLKFIWRY